MVIIGRTRCTSNSKLSLYRQPKPKMLIRSEVTSIMNPSYKNRQDNLEAFILRENFD